MARHLRSFLFSLLLGFHNAWTHDDAALEEVTVRIRTPHREAGHEALNDPARCFFWGRSSLLS
ncbi:MAG: hypothetical protein JNL05_04355 [Flavobacteriales bacterium]|nr:hypothetical protein [Flavobacteriales bacterium]